MSNRELLRSQITEAWSRCLAEDYAAQRINSERSLQASLWSRLNEILPRSSRRMFIEPGLSIIGAARQLRYPDIVICNTREVNKTGSGSLSDSIEGIAGLARCGKGAPSLVLWMTTS